MIVLKMIIGAFIANALPHLVHGISGKNFPKQLPFGNVNGKNSRVFHLVTSAIANTIWGNINLAIAITIGTTNAILNNEIWYYLFGFIIISIFLSLSFHRSRKQVINEDF